MTLTEIIFELLAQVPYLTEVVTGLVAAHALALFIVNLTPTDNDIVVKVYKYIEIAAGIIKPQNVKS